MTLKEKKLLIDFLNQHLPNWSAIVPELLNYFEKVELKENQIAPIERESLHFILSGSFGIHSKDQPLRFCITGELIVLNPGPNDRLIKVIQDTTILYLNHEDYYRLSTDTLGLKDLYDSLLRQQYPFKAFRAKLRELDKPQRLAAFRKRYPELVYKVKRYDLAKYLGISLTLLRQQF